MTTTRYGIKENQARAFNKMMRISPQKLNLVCGMVRGLPIERAIDVLKFSKKRIAGEVLKTLMSAIANAEHNKQLPIESLYIKEIWCGKALVLKRIKPGPKGGAKAILKPFSNLTIILEAGVPPKQQKKAEKAEKIAKVAKVEKVAKVAKKEIK